MQIEGIMDKFETITAASTYTLVLLANEETSDWELLDPEPVATERAQTLHARGLCFAGLLAIVDGKPRCALDVVLSPEVREAIVESFLARVTHTITHPRWCVRPDMRAN
jgi:hypothetical protein